MSFEVLSNLIYQLGARTAEGKYTSPILCVHLERHSQHNADTAQTNNAVLIQRQRAQEMQGPQQNKSEDKYAAEEEIITIPVEDVIQITSKLETKTGKQQDARSEILPQYAISENCCDRCCDSICGCWRSCWRCCCDALCCCCQKETAVDSFGSNTTTIVNQDNLYRSSKVVDEDLPVPKQEDGICDCLRCWCCRKKQLRRLIKRTYTVAEQQAQRVVTMTIQYSKYSNLDSATNARLLTIEQQAAFYKERFEPDTELRFYLISNVEINSKHFMEKKKEAEILSRTVMHLKAMRNQYPSENEFKEILNQGNYKTFGDVHEEPNL